MAVRRNEQCPLPLTQIESTEFQVAPWHLRFLNNLIDGFFIQFILFPVAVVLLAVVSAAISSVLRITFFEPPGWVFWIFGIGLWIGYFVLFEAVWQKTLGKMITGTRVVTIAGEPPSARQIVGRSIVRLVPFEALSFLAKHPVGWHDALSGTRVVDWATPHSLVQIEGRQATNSPRLAATPYRTSSTILRWVGILFTVWFVLKGMLGLMSLAQVTWFAEHLFIPIRELPDAGAAVLLNAYVGITLLLLPVFWICVALFCVWIHRANRNACALGAIGMQFTPGSCVGWVFVPVANLLKPYQAVREIYRASDPKANALTWKQSLVSRKVRWWWALWILYLLANLVGIVLAFSSSRILRVGSWWCAVAESVLAVSAAILAIGVMKSIHRRQEQKTVKQPDGVQIKVLENKANTTSGELDSSISQSTAGINTQHQQPITEADEKETSWRCDQCGASTPTTWKKCCRCGRPRYD